MFIPFAKRRVQSLTQLLFLADRDIVYTTVIMICIYVLGTSPSSTCLITSHVKLIVSTLDGVVYLLQ